MPHMNLATYEVPSTSPCLMILLKIGIILTLILYINLESLRLVESLVYTIPARLRRQNNPAGAQESLQQSLPRKRSAPYTEADKRYLCFKEVACYVVKIVAAIGYAAVVITFVAHKTESPLDNTQSRCW
jgi:hypothetical protein